MTNSRPVWKHLIYAYAVENTRILEILRRVVREMATGERLGRPNPTVLSWLRTTEDLFFSDGMGLSIFSPTSQIRDDAGATRRNAYFRLFGMDLNHGTEDGRPYSYTKADVANREFPRTFERLLREVWRAYVNRKNQIGANTTDDSALGDLVLRLHDMLRDRRLFGNLAREEFSAVATLSWFHLTVSTNNALVTTLRAEATNAAERLRCIGERVGLPANTRSYNYFQMAVDLSYVLSEIETGGITDKNVVRLYDDAEAENVVGRMLTIINNWSGATGRSLKESEGVSADGPVQRRVLAVV